MSQTITYDRMDWADIQAQTAPSLERIETGFTHEPGIYFSMSAEEYHAIPALSASGIKNLMISSMDFWANSWMNPNRTEKETSALALGSGYGVRICEGKEAFYERYTYAFDNSDYPDALDKTDEIKEALKELGVKGLSKMNKPELIQTLREIDPEAEIIDVLKHEYAVKNAGKAFLSASEIREIEIAAYMIENDPEASKCFRGGYPEVVILWIDPVTGVPMKAMLDYLKIRAIVDLKSFSNPMGKSLYNAIASAMASRKYHIQAANYIEADRMAVQFARQGRVFGKVDAEWLKEYAAIEDRTFIFVFQQTGIAPVTRVREFNRILETFKIGQVAVKDAQHRFAACWRHYGVAPWLDLKPMEQFGDEDFPEYLLEL